MTDKQFRNCITALSQPLVTSVCDILVTALSTSSTPEGILKFYNMTSYQHNGSHDTIVTYFGILVVNVVNAVLS